MVVKWLSDGSINITMFEAYIHPLVLSLKKIYDQLSKSSFQSSKLTIIVNSEVETSCLSETMLRNENGTKRDTLASEARRADPFADISVVPL